MQGNDIGNEVPPRVLVHVSSVCAKQPTLKRLFGVLTMPGESYDINMRMLAQYSLWREKGYLFELFHYTDDGYDGELVWEMLEDGYSSPFTRFIEFRDTENLSSFLAYSPDVKHVVDPLNPGRFGSKSMGDI